MALRASPGAFGLDVDGGGVLVGAGGVDVGAVVGALVVGVDEGGVG
ncbi:MAG TPA: hypothetical protein VGJ59_06525 [Jatrophihabitantaceae bacterium]